MCGEVHMWGYLRKEILYFKAFATWELELATWKTVDILKTVRFPFATIPFRGSHISSVVSCIAFPTHIVMNAVS